MDDRLAQLRERGFVWIRGGLRDAERALGTARALVDRSRDNACKL